MLKASSWIIDSREQKPDGHFPDCGLGTLQDATRLHRVAGHPEATRLMIAKILPSGSLDEPLQPDAIDVVTVGNRVAQL